MKNLTETIQYAKADATTGWLRRRGTDAGRRMIAFAILALVGVACRYLGTAIIGNSDLHDAGLYLLVGACAGFVFEYAITFF